MNNVINGGSLLLTTCIVVEIISQPKYLGVSSVQLNCYNEFQCANNVIVATPNEDDIDCWGRGSCTGSMINNIGNTSAGGTHCWGSRGCQQLSVLNGTVKYPADLRSYLALAWTNLVVTKATQCYGEASCYNISNVTSDSIGCHGFRSCAQLQGRNNTNVYADGVLSLENSILHNPSDVLLRGFYAGYNATIYCDNSTICTIRCKGNGCTTLNLICGSINNPIKCDDNTNSMYIVECDETDDIICPNGWNSNTYTTSNLDYYNYNYNILEKIISNFSNSKFDYIENIYFSECNGSNINGANSSLIMYDKQCGNYSECDSDWFIEYNNICCTSYEACTNAKINGSRNLYCEGSHGCSDTIIDGTRRDNYGRNINIYGRGRYSLRDATIKNFNLIMLNGESSGFFLRAAHGNSISCLARLACYSANITSVKNVYAGVHQAIHSGNINSGGIGTMNVHFLTIKSGYNTSITCNYNDTCVIYCVVSHSCDEIRTIRCDAHNLCDIMFINTTNSSTLIQTTTEEPGANDKYDNLDVIVSFDSQFTNDFLHVVTSININISVNDNDIDNNNSYYSLNDNYISVIALKFDCDGIFDTSTALLLSSNAKCEWINNNLTILVTLSGYSSLSTNDSLFIDKNSFWLQPINSNTTVHVISHYDHISNSSNYNYNTSDFYQVGNIVFGDNPIRPEIILSNLNTEVGICDDIVVDARNTYNLGGRKAQFNWTVELQTDNIDIHNINNSEKELASLSGPKITVTSEELSQLLSKHSLANSSNDQVNIMFTLTVEPWYRRKQTKIINITHYLNGEDATIFPVVSIDGPSYFTIDSGIYNDDIILYANFKVKSNFSCLKSQINTIANNYNYSSSMVDKYDNSNDGVTFNYQTQWNVSGNGLNRTHLNKLNEYLSDNYNTKNNNNMNNPLIIPTSSNLMMAGNTYQFKLVFECNLSYFGINVQCTTVETTHRIIYDYSSIECQITGGNLRKISNVSINWFGDHDTSLDFHLDGNTFTYDIDMFKSSNNILNKSHLSFDWSCSRVITTTAVQDDITESLEMATIFADDCSHLLKQRLSQKHQQHYYYQTI